MRLEQLPTRDIPTSHNCTDIWTVEKLFIFFFFYETASLKTAFSSAVILQVTRSLS